MSTQKGYSLVELLVTLSILTIVGGVAGVVLYSGNRVYTQESTRQVSNGQTRLSLEKAVRRLRDSAARTARVNLSLDDALGVPVLRDGLLVWTDADHQTIYIDRDESGKPGSGLPDVVGWDDRDSDGHADVLGFGLVPEDENKDGVQDFLDRNRDGVPDDLVRKNGVTDGRPDRKWRLVTRSFGSLSQALDPAQWAGAEVVSRGVVPFITVVGGVDQYDTIEVEGLRPENYDYGHDKDFAVVDSWQGDGVVDEIEIGRAVSDDSLVNAQAELDLVGAIKFMVTPSVYIEKNRVDVDRAFTSVTPRIYAIRDEARLQFPNPS